MADTPKFPEGVDNDNNRETRNIERDITNLVKSHNDLLKERIGISKSLQDQLESQDIIHQQNVKQFEKEMGRFSALMQSRSSVEAGAKADKLEYDIKSAKISINQIRDIMELEQLRVRIGIQADKDAQAESMKWVNIVKNGLTEITGLKINEFDLTKKIGKSILDQGVKLELLAYSIGAIVMMLKSTFELFKKMDTAAWEFRKAMGMTRTESSVIHKDAENIAISYMAMGVTIDQVYKSYQAIGQAVGSVHNVTRKMAADVALMSAQLGISEEISVGFMRNLAVVSRSTMESQENMMGLAQSLSSAAGTNLNQVMGDVASASGTTLVMMSRIPNVALKAAVELRHMGSSLREAAESSKHLLDFTTNIQEEMDASVLLGRSINLQRARELAYNRDLEGSTKEILRISKSVKFEQLDPFQQDAFAKATGKSVDELTKMLQTDRQLNQIRLNGTDAQKAELAAYEEMRKESDATLKSRSQDAMYQIRTMANQARIAQIQNEWNEILAKAEQWLLPIIDGLLTAVIPVMDIAQGLYAWTGAIAIVTRGIIPLASGFANIGTHIITWGKAIMAFSVTLKNSALWNLGDRIKNIGGVILRIQKTMSGWFRPISSFTTFLGKMFGTLGKALGGLFKMFGTVGKALGFLGKFGSFLGLIFEWVPVIGWVITAFQFIGNLFTRLKGIGDAFNKGFFHGLWFGLKAIVGALYDTLIQPFVNAFKWIWHFFGGHSPSLLGMGIVKGIVSIGTMLFKAITSPWRLAFGWIMNKFSSIGKFIGHLFGKKESVEKQAQAAYIPAVTISPNNTKTEPTSSTKSKKSVGESKNSATLDDILAALNTQNKLLGQLLAKDTNIKMDGQLLSATLARSTEYYGGHGVNKV